MLAAIKLSKYLSFVEDSNFDHDETPSSRAKDSHELIITVAYIIAYTAVKANGEQEKPQ